MNSLTSLIARFNLDPIQAMNRLQEVGQISDLCVTSEDVASEDRFLACQWVLLNKDEIPESPGLAPDNRVTPRNAISGRA